MYCSAAAAAAAAVAAAAFGQTAFAACFVIPAKAGIQAAPKLAVSKYAGIFKSRLMAGRRGR
jgi:hypothetical protein